MPFGQSRPGPRGPSAPPRDSLEGDAPDASSWEFTLEFGFCGKISVVEMCEKSFSLKEVSQSDDLSQPHMVLSPPSFSAPTNLPAAVRCKTVSLFRLGQSHRHEERLGSEIDVLGKSLASTAAVWITSFFFLLGRLLVFACSVGTETSLWGCKGVKCNY